ncbi:MULTISPECIES: transposase [unclassified Treponema]|uniref:transposase n=1 Tax=unclassified Treponema TaxID=2638727 RepID=UPI0020A47B33|nr:MULTISPECIES: transposase [unclassified Treponema]UTC66998.1 transposase [Treponema sp. OMZ 789]UTC69728.1 transposase [Treponema sp. OMZ 790]UTC72442.1 transposase [Treponema sp. OMZ 791]
MGRVYKNYTKEMKEQACRMVLESKMPVKIVAERFNVGLQLLYRWISLYETYGDEAFVGSGKLRSEDAKLKKLQKENEYLKLENEILKKLRAYYAEQEENRLK